MNIDAVVDPAKPQSEDIIGVSERAAWVLDGTDGRGDEQFSDEDEYNSDGVWYVEQFTEYILDNADDVSRSLREIIQDAIKHVASQYEDLHGRDDIDPTVPPAAALAIVRWRDDRLEYYNLADCSIIVEIADRDDVHVRDVGPRILDDRLDAIATGNAPEGAPTTEEHLDEQYRNRNSKDLYYVASLDPDAAYNGVQGRIPIESVESVLLFSDGVEPLVDRYGVLDSWTEAREFARSNSISALIDELRRIENEVDPKCDEFPRYKQCDDASAILLSDVR